MVEGKYVVMKVSKTRVDFSENPHSACSSSYARIPSVKI